MMLTLTMKFFTEPFWLTITSFYNMQLKISTISQTMQKCDEQLFSTSQLKILTTIEAM